MSSLDFPIDIYEKYKDKINIEELVDFFSSKETMDKEAWDKIEEYIKMIKDGGDLKMVFTDSPITLKKATNGFQVHIR